MGETPEAVELTVDHAWYLAEASGAGSFPWVLAIPPAHGDSRVMAALHDVISRELADLGVIAPDGTITPRVCDWVRTVCHPERQLDLRYVVCAGPTRAGDVLRGVVAHKGGGTVVALRNAQLVTFTELSVEHPRSLAAVLTAPLAAPGSRAGIPARTEPAQFEPFMLPLRAGAVADEQLRSGSPVDEVLHRLSIPASAREVVRAALEPTRTYVEVVAADHRDGQHASTDVGLAVVDTTSGRVLVSPSKTTGGEWVSTFAPGSEFAIALAVEQLAETLPRGRWFPEHQLTKHFA